MAVSHRFPRRLRVVPRGPTHGVLRVPGSKSFTNRALVCASLADGVSTLTGALQSDDTRVMMDCLTRLGSSFSPSTDSVTVAGTGGRLVAASQVLDAAASGTTARFITAVATLAEGESTIDGTARMRRRPIGELVDALRSLGAELEILGSEGGPPVRVAGGGLEGGHVVIDARRSSQFVSAIALAAPYSRLETSLEFLDGKLVSRPYVVNTVEVMAGFGVEADLTERGIRISPGGYRSSAYRVEPDASAATYPLVAAAITGGWAQLPGFDRRSTQADLGVLDVLTHMGCRVEWGTGAVSLTGPAGGLRGVEVDMGRMPDAALAIAVSAAFASSPSRLTNVGNLRIKESDRLTALETELRKLGVAAEADLDSLVIRPGKLHGAEIDTYEDHRMAMAFSLAGLVIDGVVIRDPGCVTKTWPSFFEDLEQLWPGDGRTPNPPLAGPGGRKAMVVAIDGPGGAGKTTVSRGVAERLELPHLDTGAFYRAAALAAERAGADLADTEAVVRAVRVADFDYRDGTMWLAGNDIGRAIRDPDVTSRASRVSVIPEVREVLVARQRSWVDDRGGSAVVEGRDMGTVVFPGAAVKIFLTARPEIRATRRARELPEGSDSLAGVTEELERRDRRDSTRETSPLRPAPDAVEIDTSDLTIDEVIAKIVKLSGDRSA